MLYSCFNKILGSIVLIIITLFFICGLSSKLKICKYSLESSKVKNKIKIILISDLHSCKYGKDQEELTEKIDFESPDIIALAGDIFDRKLSDKNSEIFLKKISDRYPCYYVTGNHEYYRGTWVFSRRMKFIEENKIKRLPFRKESIEVNGSTIDIFGVDDPIAFKKEFYRGENFKNKLCNLAKEINPEHYSILISHRPEKFQLYENCKFDLALCGHAHGGQWRIPFFLNGLYAPGQGIFPKFAGGEYKKDSTTMIVGRGLARESVIIPRFYNRPELIIIDIIPSEKPI